MRCGFKALLWVIPLPSNSHHQDYSIFSRESQAKPSFATVTGKGDNPSSTSKKTGGLSFSWFWHTRFGLTRSDTDFSDSVSFLS